MIIMDLQTKGFAVVTKALDVSLCMQKRKVCEDLFNAEAFSELTPYRFLNSADLIDVFTLPKVIIAIRTLFPKGGILLPNFTVRREYYVPWHIDRSFRDVSAPKNIVQFGLYLQDNDPWHGGGLDVIPGSHRWEIRPNQYEPSNKRKCQRIDSHAGDLIMWNPCVWHRSSPHGIRRNQQVKFQIHWTIALNHEEGLQALKLISDQSQKLFEQSADRRLAIRDFMPNMLSEHVLDKLAISGLQIITLHDHP